MDPSLSKKHAPTRRNMWTYRSLASGYETTTPLTLYWEAHCDPISDDWEPEDIDAHALLRMWVQRYYPDRFGESMYGPGMVHIYWGVRGKDGHGVFEKAPFAADALDAREDENFLTELSWPVHADTGERVNWAALPVVDKLWRPGRRGRADKGGFIQEATGWKPSPLQPAFHLPGILAAAGIGNLVPYMARPWPTLSAASSEVPL